MDHSRDAKPQRPSDPHSHTVPTREFGRTPETYASLVTFISGISTFTGAVTFSILFQIDCPGDEHIPKLLAFSSVLFLGAALGCVPIMLGLHTQRDEPLDPDEDSNMDRVPSHRPKRVTEPTLTFVRTQVVLVSILMVGAFCCLFLAILFLSYGAQGLLGFAIILLTVLSSLCGYFNVPRSPTGIWIMQGCFLVILMLVAVIFGKINITNIQWENRCQRMTKM